MTVKSKSRMATAFSAGAAETARAPKPDIKELPSGGNWSRLALQDMKDDLEVTREELGHAHQLQLDGILGGTIPLSIPTDQIEDIIGSDRIVEAPEEEIDPSSYAALVDNIRKRGQRTPIRVRPTDPDWRPNPDSPRDIAGQTFALQSGRRRLMACRELGIPCMAFLSFTEGGEERLDDLHERFFENVARKDLTLVEKLYSIGLIARETKDATQSQIAEILGVGIAQVSRGLALVQHFDRLRGDIDLARATRDEIDCQLKKYREKADTPDAVRKRVTRATSRDGSRTALPFDKVETGFGTLRLRQKGKRRELVLSGPHLDDSHIAEIVRRLRADPATAPDCGPEDPD